MLNRITFTSFQLKWSCLFTYLQKKFRVYPDEKKYILLQNNNVVDWRFFCFYKWKLWNFILSFVIIYLPMIWMRVACRHTGDTASEMKQSKFTFHVLAFSLTMFFSKDLTEHYFTCNFPEVIRSKYFWKSCIKSKITQLSVRNKYMSYGLLSL